MSLHEVNLHCHFSGYLLLKVLTHRLFLTMHVFQHSEKTGIQIFK